jgi:hypothetical protein
MKERLPIKSRTPTHHNDPQRTTPPSNRSFYNIYPIDEITAEIYGNLKGAVFDRLKKLLLFLEIHSLLQFLTPIIQ